MKLYQVVIDYPSSFVTSAWMRSRLKTKHLAYRLQEDDAYASDDAKWSIGSKDVSFLEWLTTEWGWVW